MPKRLILVRHATAQNYAAGGDFARSLTAYGQDQAFQLGQHLVDYWDPTGIVWVSPAQRTLETWNQISKSLSCPNPVQDMSIYDGAVDNLLELISVSESSQVMIVGHEPNISQTATFLVPENHRSVDDFMYGVKTATGIVLDLPSDPKEVAEGSASLVQILHG